MAVTTVVPGLWQVALGHVNAFLLEGENGVVLVDTGLPGRIDGLSAAVSEAGYRWRQVSDVLVTHGHIDHVGSLAAVVSSSGATVWAHAHDASTIEKGVPSSPMTGRGKADGHDDQAEGG